MPLRRLFSHGDFGAYSNEIPKFLEAVQHQQGAIDSSLQAVPRVVAPEYGSAARGAGARVQANSVFFLDRMLEGQRVGDANGFIGVIGTGKTTTAAHMAVASAQQSHREALLQNRRPELTIFITAEESGKKVMPRLQSAAFQIPSESWQRCGTGAPYDAANTGALRARARGLGDAG
jgi:hypothetical protein